MARNNLNDFKEDKQRRSTTPLKKGFIRKNNIKVKMGPNYQADIPELLSHTEEYTERQESLLIWLPSDDLKEDDEFTNYSLISKTKYGYNTEQTLGLLFSNNFNLKKSFQDLSKYFPIISWSNFEKYNFEIAFKKFGKNFEQIRKQIPNKSLKEIIGYYYLRKYKKNASNNVKGSIIKMKPCCKRHQKVNCEKSDLTKFNNK